MSTKRPLDLKNDRPKAAATAAPAAMAVFQDTIAAKMSSPPDTPSVEPALKANQHHHKIKPPNAAFRGLDLSGK
jgi:hypothetical protein